MIFEGPMTEEDLIVKCARFIPAWLIDAMYLRSDCFIAGGFFQRVCNNKPEHGDIDLFCKDRRMADDILERATKLFGVVKLDDTENAITCKRPGDRMTVQLIYDPKWTQPFTRDDVVEKFDIRSTQISLYWGRLVHLEAVPEAIEDIETKTVTLNKQGVHSRYRTMARIINKVGEGFFTPVGSANAIRQLMIMSDSSCLIPTEEEFAANFSHRY